MKLRLLLVTEEEVKPKRRTRKKAAKPEAESAPVDASDDSAADSLRRSEATAKPAAKTRKKAAKSAGTTKKKAAAKKVQRKKAAKAAEPAAATGAEEKPNRPMARLPSREPVSLPPDVVEVGSSDPAARRKGCGTAGDRRPPEGEPPDRRLVICQKFRKLVVYPAASLFHKRCCQQKTGVDVASAPDQNPTQGYRQHGSGAACVCQFD